MKAGPNLLSDNHSGAFSDNVEEVIQAGELVIRTYLKEGIIPCIKHYPGHGDANADSHKTLPEIDLDMNIMEDIHIKPFKALSFAPMLMAAHLHVKCFDKDVIPTSMSKNALTYLRKNIGYDGVIISDDMIMQGVQGYPLEYGIMAGLNMFIFRNSNNETINKIEDLYKKALISKPLQEKIEDSFNRVQRLKKSTNKIDIFAQANSLL